MTAPDTGPPRPPAADVCAVQTKKWPQRYIRFYPNNVAHLKGFLTPEQIGALLTLSSHWANVPVELPLCPPPGLPDGWLRKHVKGLPDDDVKLARLAGLDPRKWKTLRAELLEHGLFVVENGRWVDQMQMQSLEQQVNASLRAQRGGETKAARRRQLENSHG